MVYLSTHATVDNLYYFIVWANNMVLDVPTNIHSLVISMNVACEMDLQTSFNLTQWDYISHSKTIITI